MMNNRKRFKVVAHFETPDYIPIFGLPGAPGMSGGCLGRTHEHLVATGMPASVGGKHEKDGMKDVESWRRYWGTAGPIGPGFSLGEPAKGFHTESRMDGEYEIITCETGCVTRQLIDNAVTYTMPHYISYHVRDRKSWEFYMSRATPGKRWDTDRIDKACQPYIRRDQPLAVGARGTWGALRGLMGPEMACTVLYDDPGLAHEIMDWFAWLNRTYVFPLIEQLKPEIVQTGEDMCYNHGMFISPSQFREFCAPNYKELADISRASGVDMMAVDSDGCVMDLVPLLEECGMNAMIPFEAKAGNDLFALRQRHPSFILTGWLEKEAVNTGNGHLIEAEIMSKVPPLLKKGGYFPNLEHGMQPMADFHNVCRFMTLLHEVTGNPEGEFPRVYE